MDIREIELPGIGKKFEIMNQNDEKTVIIIHDDGTREIYTYEKGDEEESISNVSFSDEEARQVAGILGGMAYKPKDLAEIDMQFGNDFGIKWQKVEEGAPAANRTIGDIGIRNQYGIMIIAIIRHDKTKLFNPGPETCLEVGDTLIISGEKSTIKSATKELLCKGGS